jgi:hypothetical protein
MIGPRHTSTASHSKEQWRLIICKACQHAVVSWLHVASSQCISSHKLHAYRAQRGVTKRHCASSSHKVRPRCIASTLEVLYCYVLCLQCLTRDNTTLWSSPHTPPVANASLQAVSRHYCSFIVLFNSCVTATVCIVILMYTDCLCLHTLYMHILDAQGTSMYNDWHSLYKLLNKHTVQHQGRWNTCK